MAGGKYVMKNMKKGFTLAELLIVVAIIAVLVAISLPIFSNQLEKSRRAVDISNARDIVAVFAAAVNSGTMEIPDVDSTVWVEVHRETIFYGKGTADDQANSSQMARIDGVALNNINRNEKIRKLLTDSGLTEDALKIHCKNAADSWGWYVVCIKGDGTVHVRSGVGTDNNRKIKNNTDMINLIKVNTKIQEYFNN